MQHHSQAIAAPLTDHLHYHCRLERTQSEDEHVCSYSISKSLESPLMAQSDAKEEGREQNSPTESLTGTRPSTPPFRSEAFEQFKRERGSEINKILVLNKG